MDQIIKINNFTIIFNKTDSETTLVEAYINNGAIYENKDNVGISHLLEHIVCEGWKKCKGPCSVYWSKRGVQTNASTGQTYVNYFMHGLKKYSVEMMEYIAGISMKPIMTKKRLKKEKLAVRTELNMHKTQPELELYDELNKILFNIYGLQYQDDLDTQLDLLESFSLADIREWLNKYYNSLINNLKNYNLKNICINLYLANDLKNYITELIKFPFLNIFLMKSNSIGAQPGTLWRFMNITNKSYKKVFICDIDDNWDWIKIWNNKNYNYKLCTLKPKDKIISNNPYTPAYNFATIIGSHIMVNPNK